MDVETFYCMYVGHNCDESTCPYYIKEKGRCAFEGHWDSEPVACPVGQIYFIDKETQERVYETKNGWNDIEKGLEVVRRYQRERVDENGRKPVVYAYAPSAENGYGAEFRSKDGRGCRRR